MLQSEKRVKTWRNGLKTLKKWRKHVLQYLLKKLWVVAYTKDPCHESPLKNRGKKKGKKQQVFASHYKKNE